MKKGTYLTRRKVHGFILIFKSGKGYKGIDVCLQGAKFPFEFFTTDVIENRNQFIREVNEITEYLKEAYTSDTILEANKYLY